MNTPTHLLANLALLSKGKKAAELKTLTWPILLGGFLPDAPIFIFYAYEKLRGTTEAQIWSTNYFQESWQTAIDICNSLPLIALGLLVAYLLKKLPLQAFFMSMGLHSLMDFPVHVDDAHRHFYPISNYRFQSPVSYWDPNHHGRMFALIETSLLIIFTLLLWKRYPRIWPRAIMVATCTIYMAIYCTVYLLGMGWS